MSFVGNRIKLVITHPSQLSERWVNYYCLEELSKVFDVEFWDCSALAYPSFTVAHPLTPDYLRVIHTLQEFEENLKRLPRDTVLITEVHYNSKTYLLHRIQGKYFPLYAHINFYGNDIDKIWQEKPSSQSSSKKKKNDIKSWLYKSPMVRDFSKWLFHHRDDDYQKKRMQIKCAECYLDCFSMSCVGTSAHRVNHPDFEQYLHVNGKARIIDKPYVVFIDDFYPYHPEAFVYHEIDNVEEVAKYYHNTMNAFFDYVEKEMNCKIVIAAHPYANYLECNPFNGRDIYYGKTAQLIKDCEAVCQHCSNAYSFVALFDKPVAFITNIALEKSLIGDATRLCGEKFGIQAFYTDDISTYPKHTFIKMNADLRMKYINQYLGDINHPQPNSKLIQRYIEEFHDNLVNMK